jgi:hypothetical protein
MAIKERRKNKIYNDFKIEKIKSIIINNSKKLFVF